MTAPLLDADPAASGVADARGGPPVVQQLLPEPTRVAVPALVARLRAAPSPRPFDDEVVDFCSELSRRLARDPEARRAPAIQALAFWMRRAELVRMRDAFRALERPDELLVPRGVVFHLPPANVDTIFVYSWLVSVLVGNRNVLRLSSRRSAQTEVLLRCFGESLAAGGVVREGTAVVTYGHERPPTALLSDGCDLRVVWGGDATVRAIREVPLPPRARELAFPNRFSLAALRIDAYEALDEAARDALAERFYNDTYWFDQLGCSSPRVLVWVGDASRSARCAADLLPRLLRVTEAKGYVAETGTVLGKVTYGYRNAMDGTVTRIETPGNALTVLTLDDLSALPREHPGGGLLLQAAVPTLAALAPAITGTDQTLAHFGFTAAELRAFVATLNGRGLDRLVPVGRALTFGRVWDGVDLLQEMTRRVVVEAEQAEVGSARS